MVEPGLLDLRAGCRGADCLDGRHLRLADAVDRCLTRARGNPVDMHGARAAQRLAAPELRSGHAEHVAQHPKQRGVTVDVETMGYSIDFDGHGHNGISPGLAPRRAQPRGWNSGVSGLRRKELAPAARADVALHELACARRLEIVTTAAALIALRHGLIFRVTLSELLLRLRPRSHNGSGRAERKGRAAKHCTA